MYHINYTNSAERFFKKLKDRQLLSKFRLAIERISIDPYCGSLKTGDLSGIYGYDISYKGINYELAYRIYEKDDNLVVVMLAGIRENFYNELKRLVK